MTLWLIMRRPIWERHTEWLLFLQVLARSNLWPSECCKASSCMTQSDAQKHDKSMSGPLKTSCPATKAIETKNARLEKVFGVFRNRPHSNTRETWLLHPKCSLDNAHGFLHDTEFRQFVPEQTCVGGTPQCGPLGSYLSPVLHNKAHSNSGRSQMLYTESGISNVTPVLWPLFTLARASHWNPSPCWKSPALSKLDYKHMKLWIVQNVFKFSYQTLCIQKYVKIKYEDGVNLLQNFTKTSRLLPFFV